MSENIKTVGEQIIVCSPASWVILTLADFIPVEEYSFSTFLPSPDSSSLPLHSYDGFFKSSPGSTVQVIGVLIRANERSG